MSENFESSFNLFEGFFNNQITSFQLIATFGGGVMILCGLFIVGLITFYRVKGQRVTLEVIGLHEEARRIDKDDDAEDVARKRASPKVRLEFRVVNGPSVGAEAISSSSGSTVEHAIGDVVPGYFFPSSKDVLSRAQTITGYKFGLIMAGAGLVFIMLIDTMIHQW
jgi:hypothetical protein